MKWHQFPVPDEYRDGRKLLALQNGEMFVIRYDQSTLPPTLTFRYHRNRVERHYRYIQVELDGETVEAQVPLHQPWLETFESVWLVKLRGFVFSPNLWAPCDLT